MLKKVKNKFLDSIHITLTTHWTFFSSKAQLVRNVICTFLRKPTDRQTKQPRQKLTSLAPAINI